ncbi:MAG: hypothetical protein IT373_03860, partial [Polyangiaceae bacterium]|nr:hypothetical protein [Polyangiaceae bacterium]
RMREFGSAGAIGWGSVVATTSFYGIDTNPFAVELAKVTLNIAKKIAFDDRRQKAAEATGQGVLELDPSLPLDNLDKNIVCADALFTDWPEVEAIVGNPPILGDRKIRGELGRDYMARLQASSGLDGVVDLSCHWFRRAQDRLPEGGRAGLVGTSGIRVGKARAATLDYIVANGGTITNAVSSVLWPGEAALNVSMVNWIKADAPGPHALLVEGATYQLSRIPTHLQLHADVSDARPIAHNASGAMVGLTLGTDAFVVPRTHALARDRGLGSAGVLRPMATATALLTARMSSEPDFVICLGTCSTRREAAEVGGAAFAHLERTLRPHVMGLGDQYPGWSERWWQPWRPRPEFFAEAAKQTRVVTCSKVQARPIFAFVASAFVPNDTMQVFAFDDDFTFGILQSRAHWAWLKAKGGKVRQDIRYTNEVWTTFPWPQEIGVSEVARVAAAARELRATRDRLMEANGWSLRDLHRAAEVDGPHPLNDAQHALDEAVESAYGKPADQDVIEFLLELNRCLVEDEEQGKTVAGPGLPPGLDPKDRRWHSDDCIEPPPVRE